MSKQFTLIVVATLLSWTVFGNPIFIDSYSRTESSLSGGFRYESGEASRDSRYEIGKTRERPPVDPMKERYYKFGHCSKVSGNEVLI